MILNEQYYTTPGGSLWGVQGDLSGPMDYLGIKGLLVGDSSPMKSLDCVFEQATLSAA